MICSVCGGLLAEIRGRYPGDLGRWVCPTCLQEKLEGIREALDPGFGQVSCAPTNMIKGEKICGHLKKI